jgi:hypothetical protein
MQETLRSASLTKQLVEKKSEEEDSGSTISALKVRLRAQTKTAKAEKFELKTKLKASEAVKQASAAKKSMQLKDFNPRLMSGVKGLKKETNPQLISLIGESVAPGSLCRSQRLTHFSAGEVAKLLLKQQHRLVPDNTARWKNCNHEAACIGEKMITSSVNAASRFMLQYIHEQV